jgi:hypothetical protein
VSPLVPPVIVKVLPETLGLVLLALVISDDTHIALDTTVAVQLPPAVQLPLLAVLVTVVVAKVVVAVTANVDPRVTAPLTTSVLVWVLEPVIKVPPVPPFKIIALAPLVLPMVITLPLPTVAILTALAPEPTLKFKVLLTELEAMEIMPLWAVLPMVMVAVAIGLNKMLPVPDCRVKLVVPVVLPMVTPVAALVPKFKPAAESIVSAPELVDQVEAAAPCKVKAPSLVTLFTPNVNAAKALAAKPKDAAAQAAAKAILILFDIFIFLSFL